MMKINKNHTDDDSKACDIHLFPQERLKWIKIEIQEFECFINRKLFQNSFIDTESRIKTKKKFVLYYYDKKNWILFDEKLLAGKGTKEKLVINILLLTINDNMKKIMIIRMKKIG